MATSVIGLINQAPFIADPASISQNTGRQIDWANVSTTDPATGKKYIPAGTACGELLSTNGTISPRVVTTNPATCILLTAAYEDDPSAAATGYGCLVGGVLFENLLPQASGGPPKTLAAAIKTELANAGCFFTWEKYSDTRTTLV